MTWKMPGEKMHSCIPKASVISLTLLESHLTTYSMRPRGACNKHKRKKRIEYHQKYLLSVKFLPRVNLKQSWQYDSLYIKLAATTVKREQMQNEKDSAAMI